LDFIAFLIEFMAPCGNVDYSYLDPFGTHEFLYFMGIELSTEEYEH